MIYMSFRFPHDPGWLVSHEYEKGRQMRKITIIDATPQMTVAQMIAFPYLLTISSLPKRLFISARQRIFYVLNKNESDHHTENKKR